MTILIETARAGLGGLSQLAFDILSTLLFLALLLATDDILLATGAALAAGVGQAVWMIWRKQKIDPMQWMAMALVLGLGGATLLTRNPTFVMLKPSILEGGLALMLLRPGWMARYLPGHGTDRLPNWLAVAWGYLWAVAWFAMAVSNLVVARLYGLKAWAIYTHVAPFVLFGVLFGLGLIRGAVLARVLPPPAPGASTPHPKLALEPSHARDT